jgi:hypothetical protein
MASAAAALLKNHVCYLTNIIKLITIIIETSHRMKVKFKDNIIDLHRAMEIKEK